MKRVIGALAAVATTAALAVTGVAHAGSDMTNYCDHNRAEILDLPHQMFAAWADGDAAGVGAVFTADGHFIPSNGTYLVGRDAIVDYYTHAFAGPLKGTRVIGNPQSVRCLGPNAAVIDGYGGILLPGETYTDPAQVPIGRRIIVSWTAVRESNTVWKMTEFESTGISQ